MDLAAWFASYFAVQSIVGSSFAVIASVTALCAIGDLAIAGAVHLALNYAADQLPTGTHRDELDLIKSAVFYGFTSPAVKDDLKSLRKALDVFSSKPDKVKADEIISLLQKIDEKLTEINNNSSPDDTTAEEHCIMNWMAGNSLYNLARYEEAMLNSKNSTSLTNKNSPAVSDRGAIFVSRLPQTCGVL